MRATASRNRCGSSSHIEEKAITCWLESGNAGKLFNILRDLLQQVFLPGLDNDLESACIVVMDHGGWKARGKSDRQPGFSKRHTQPLVQPALPVHSPGKQTSHRKMAIHPDRMRLIRQQTSRRDLRRKSRSARAQGPSRRPSAWSTRLSPRAGKQDVMAAVRGTLQQVRIACRLETVQSKQVDRLDVPDD